ncbi:MAG: N-acetylmuramic acid 6-phosphate etherase [Devosia sp.]
MTSRIAETAAGRSSTNAAASTRQALLSELQQLVSEDRNPASMGIDLMSAAEIVAVINTEDRLVPFAVGETLPQVAAAVDAIVAAFHNGGRLVYIGAGTSGRLGVLDASECPPTFGTPRGMVIGLIAGGEDALVRATEGAEDRTEVGADDLRSIALERRDVVVGIAVSGRTPYVIGALNYAKSLGAVTVGLTCNPDSAIARMADISIAPLVGAEVLTGSTRLKSGSAQKLVLNMLSTGSMIRIGKTYQNLMVDLHASNEKLLARAVRIVMQATDARIEDAEAALERTGNDVKLAILTTLTGQSVDSARAAMAGAGGFLRRALKGASR